MKQLTEEFLELARGLYGQDPVTLGLFNSESLRGLTLNGQVIENCRLDITPRDRSQDNKTSPNPMLPLDFVHANTLHLLTSCNGFQFQDDISLFPTQIKHLVGEKVEEPEDPAWVLKRPDITRTIEVINIISRCFENLRTKHKIDKLWLNRRSAADRLVELMAYNPDVSLRPPIHLLETLGKRATQGFEPSSTMILPARKHLEMPALPAAKSTCPLVIPDN